MPAIKILGHRGSKRFPENTLPAFEDALEYADGFEFDIQYSKDGIPVVIHDDTIDRTTNGTGAVDSFTLAELKQFQVRDNDGKLRPDIVIPTLAEVMDLASLYIKRRPEIVINIEIKNQRATAKVMAIVEDYIQQRGWAYGNVIVSSFEHGALRQAKQVNANIPLGILYEPEQEKEVRKVIAEINPYAVHPSLSELESKIFDPTSCNKALVVWIYGEKPYPANMQGIQRILAAKPVIIITNYPQEVKMQLQNPEARLSIKD